MEKSLPEKKLRLSQEVLSVEISSGVTLASVSSKLKAIQAFQQLVRSQLRIGTDYGTIPGTPKPGLWKPGAEKIAKLLGCSDKYEIIEKVEDWGRPLFSYKVKCQLHSISSGELISEGIGECNSMEAKYRYRWIYENQIPRHLLKDDLITKTIKGKAGGSFTVYRIENDDIYTQINTILKMSKKRALVDAALSAGRLSDIFTQDIEEKVDIDLPETFAEGDKEKDSPSTPKKTESDVKMPQETAEIQEEAPDRSIVKELNVIEALKQPVDATFDVWGILFDYKTRQVNTKNGKSDITDYELSPRESTELIKISKWGGLTEGISCGDTISFKGVTVKLFRDEKQYLAQGIEMIEKAKE